LFIVEARKAGHCIFLPFLQMAYALLHIRHVPEIHFCYRDREQLPNYQWWQNKNG
jgi:hypothetical protein